MYWILVVTLRTVVSNPSKLRSPIKNQEQRTNEVLDLHMQTQSHELTTRAIFFNFSSPLCVVPPRNVKLLSLYLKEPYERNLFNFPFKRRVPLEIFFLLEIKAKCQQESAPISSQPVHRIMKKICVNQSFCLFLILLRAKGLFTNCVRAQGGGDLEIRTVANDRWDRVEMYSCVRKGKGVKNIEKS